MELFFSTSLLQPARYNGESLSCCESCGIHMGVWRLLIQQKRMSSQFRRVRVHAYIACGSNTRGKFGTRIIMTRISKALKETRGLRYCALLLISTTRTASRRRRREVSRNMKHANFSRRMLVDECSVYATSSALSTPISGL